MEVGNILASSYLMAIGKMTDLSLLPSPTAISVDMSAAILSTTASEFAAQENEALTIAAYIGEGVGQIDGFFIYIPESGSLAVILRSADGVLNG